LVVGLNSIECIVGFPTH